MCLCLRSHLFANEVSSIPQTVWIDKKVLITVYNVQNCNFGVVIVGYMALNEHGDQVVCTPVSTTCELLHAETADTGPG